MDVSLRGQAGKQALLREMSKETTKEMTKKADNEAANKVTDGLMKGPRDKWSFWTHFAGIVFGVMATIYFLIVKVFGTAGVSGAVGVSGAAGGTLSAVSFVVFGLSVIALYTGSSVYHYYNGPAEKLVRIRKLDHSMIYVMIAGSYTPVLANCLPMPKGAVFLAAIWLVALAGIVIKVCWLDAPRWLYTSLYILMGWSILVDPKSLGLIDPRCLAMIAAGGVAYTIGAVIYILKKPNLTEEFGFHEIFHCFILLGTLLQFIGIAVVI